MSTPHTTASLFSGPPALTVAPPSGSRCATAKRDRRARNTKTSCLQTLQSTPSKVRIIKKVKASSYIAQYPVLRTAQCALHFTSLTDLFTQTPSRLLWEASSHMLQFMHGGCSYTYPPLSIARYSFIQLSKLEQCRVKNLPKVLTLQNRIRTRVLLVKSPKLYP